MQKFVAKHAAATTGTLSCFDRLLCKGHLALGYEKVLDGVLRAHGVRLQDFKPFVLKLADRLQAHAHAVAERAGRPWEYLAAPVRKDQWARAVAVRDGITDGLVCVFATVEPCWSVRVAYGRGCRTIRRAPRKCLFLSFDFYFVDPTFGHVDPVPLAFFRTFAHVSVYLTRHFDSAGTNLPAKYFPSTFCWHDAYFAAAS